MRAVNQDMLCMHGEAVMPHMSCKSPRTVHARPPRTGTAGQDTRAEPIGPIQAQIRTCPLMEKNSACVRPSWKLRESLIAVQVIRLRVM